MRKSREKIVRKRDREKDSPTLTPIPTPTPTPTPTANTTSNKEDQILEEERVRRVERIESKM
jgi:hypothetical protein